MRGSICGFCRRLVTFTFLSIFVLGFESIDSYAETSNGSANTYIEEESTDDFEILKNRLDEGFSNEKFEESYFDTSKEIVKSNMISNQIDFFEEKLAYLGKATSDHVGLKFMLATISISTLLMAAGISVINHDSGLSMNQPSEGIREATEEVKNHPSLMLPLAVSKGDYPCIITELNECKESLNLMNKIETFLSVQKKERWIKLKQSIY